ncbi:MAG TPA: valine--tRNA ligase [Lachnospiraceae bacterium]|nr:valine--tRNA ligase [Lachnospiraceae bacterium]
MKKELEKTYDPKGLEERLYKKWMDQGCFHAEVNPDKKPFTIVMPPPNITGQLHMGHALDNTLQDILIRWKRMQGYEALWQPGTDHAAIATEVKVTEHLREQGIDKEKIGREEFLKYCWEWRKEYGGRIIRQLHEMGSSADWERERFTMDEGCSDAVQEVFLRLYEKGYIYKGSKIINWCPVCRTTISDAEVEHVDQEGNFWHINYPVAGEEGKFVEIATTRPETLLGDTAVAVNPKDERYTGIVGKLLKLPLTDRVIPVIADEYVDMEFGTGCVKITPAHDPNDFEVGKRHHLEEINILNDDGTMNGQCGKYAGMDRYEARKKMVDDLKELGLLVKVVPCTHAVGTHDRCGTTVEPMIKQQWFVRMDEMAKPAIEAVKSGELTFVPERFDKIYLHWLENIHDWCISRQLWWGHRIPAYYCRKCGKMIVAKEMPDTCPDCGGTEFEQDPDTLDTWFSSALWPFSTLGWPKETPEFKYFYPTDVLVTGYDIIFFWVIRMVFSGIEQTGKCPFRHVLIHGLIRDSQGRKMSKSLGNGIDPLEVIDKYGADALRLTLVTGNAPGNDMRFYWEQVEASRNFANKIWNASRFIMMNLPEEELPEPSAEDLRPADRWILSRVNTIAKEVTDNMERFELGIAVQKIHDFLWEEFCDWYIEIAKLRLVKKNDSEDLRISADAALWTLRTVLTEALKLLHPYMPFITEEIYCTLLPSEKTIMTAEWPKYREDRNFPEDERLIGEYQELVRGIRGIRMEMNVPAGTKTELTIVGKDEAACRDFEILKDTLAGMERMVFATEVRIQSGKEGVGDDAVTVVTSRATAYIPLDELVDREKEIARLNQENAKMDKEIARGEGMLGNPNFLGKAPAAKIAEEREKLAKYKAVKQQIVDQLAGYTKQG